MKEHAPTPEGRATNAGQAKPASTPAASARQAGPSPAQALSLQRMAGNRATARTLARWAAHPDPDKKGVVLPDVVAEEFVRFNPPKNQ